MRNQNSWPISCYKPAMRFAFPNLRGLCLLDGDNRDEPDAETTGAGLAVLRWRRYEIENYLLQPEAIKRFIRVHVSLVRVKASTEFLGPLLDTLEKSTPKRDLYLLAAAMRAEEIHPEIREKLDRIAESLNPRESIR